MSKILGPGSTLWNNKQVILVVLSLLCGVGLSAGLVSSQSQPGEPQSFFGTIEEEDGTPAPQGVEVFAIINGSVEDSLNISSAGQYGGEGTFDDRLTVNTGAGDQVEFRVFDPNSGALALESPFPLADAENEPQELNLTFPNGTFNDTQAPASFQTSITNATADLTEGEELVVEYEIEILAM